ncbi:MAG: hypothetical protein EOO39_32795, partial [Cytophagaceae bacterium]
MTGQFCFTVAGPGNILIWENTWRIQSKIEWGGLRIAHQKAGDLLLVSAWKGTEKLGEQSVTPGQEINLAVANSELWSPSKPNLYDLKISVMRKGK